MSNFHFLLHKMITVDFFIPRMFQVSTWKYWFIVNIGSLCAHCFLSSIGYKFTSFQKFMNSYTCERTITLSRHSISKLWLTLRLMWIEWRMWINTRDCGHLHEGWETALMVWARNFSQCLQGILHIAPAVCVISKWYWRKWAKGQCQLWTTCSGGDLNLQRLIYTSLTFPRQCILTRQTVKRLQSIYIVQLSFGDDSFWPGNIQLMGVSECTISTKDAHNCQCISTSQLVLMRGRGRKGCPNGFTNGFHLLVK